MHCILSLSLLALLAKRTYAAPAILEERSVTQLSAADLSSLAPFTQFSRAAYCPTNTLQGWNCGGDCYFIQIWIPLNLGLIEACAAIPGFQPTVVGGDGNDVQICEWQTSSVFLLLTSHEYLVFVGLWSDQNSIVVAHQGSDPTQL
jgi:hypothetical protein